MFRKYFQLVRPTVNARNQFMLRVNNDFINTLTSKRWAGHSKWQNIKHIKQAQDIQRNMEFQRLGKKIMIEVKKNGPNPDFNFKLRQVIRECVKASMPKDKIENFLKKSEKYNSASLWLLYTGNNGFQVAAETRYENPKQAASKLGTFFKKLGLKQEKSLIGFCEEKGFIYSDPLSNDSKAYDKAVEDAIEIGIDEVVEGDDKTLIFECKPTMLDVAQKKLSDKGYNIISANSEIEFNTFVNLSEIEMEAFETAVEKAKKNCEIIRVVHNASGN